ncbi:mechanosensitive ion channel protein MscS [Halalkalibacillus sediminis]|uniref:Mechanosensitive ion channel protein MscS n=1 Tax=Halalkalibacillus sediminis TaxID=2018042 RepID=A0A2I0QSV6_9BACI|nr:mechanosensitive ion channel family protein [Halalkalibacillus sediminis]PKR77425.1 mechanosensitive ion channel protein MscS [Halalkalibacillus sediminis]
MDEIKNWWDEAITYLINEGILALIGFKFLRIVLIIILAIIVTKVGKRIIQKIFSRRDEGPFRITERREQTLSKLLENVLRYVVYFVAAIMILETFNFQVGALLAGAGIAGLAIGFGAQNLVKDIITGFFIIFEDQFSVGDYVRIGGHEGTVEQIGMRTTRVKSWTGELFVIPNGNIQEVTNYSIYNSIAVVDVSISYEGKINEAERALEGLLEEVFDQYDELVTKPELLGVQNLGNSDVVLRVIAETHPMMHWFMGRELRKVIKNRFDEQNIEIPFPRLVMYSRHEEEEQDKIEDPNKIDDRKE